LRSRKEMQKQTLIYVGGFILPDKNAAAHRVIANAKIFRKLGYDVIFVGATKDDSGYNIALKQKRVQGFQYYEVPYPKNIFDWLEYTASIKIITKIMVLHKSANIKGIITYNYPALGLLKLILISGRRGLKIIADSTEWYGGGASSLLFRCIKKLDNYMRMSHLHKNCDGVICISKYIQSLYPQTATVLLPPLVDVAEEKWKLPIKVPDAQKVFTYVGSPGSSVEKENFETILSTFSKLPKQIDIVLQIVGVSAQEALGSSRSELKPPNQNRVKYLGHLTNRECIKVINASHFFIFIRNESVVTKAGFPTKFVESITAGTPVVTNVSSDLEDYLESGRNGFWIDSTNKEKMLETIKNLISLDDKTVLSMKESCHSSQLFHYEQYSDSFGDFIFNIFNNQP
jgi:glycosyltransferase involved in cell wall biosynthesis